MRLSNYKRSRIANEMINPVSDKHINKAYELMKKEGSRVMKRLIDKKHLALANDPENKDLFDFRIESYVYFDNCGQNIICDIAFPKFADYHKTSEKYIVFCEKYIKLRSNWQELQNKRCELFRGVMSVLNQCHTAKKAVEAFPEHEKLINKLAGVAETVTAVVVNSDHVKSCLKNFPNCEANKAKANEKGAGRALREAKKK